MTRAILKLILGIILFAVAIIIGPIAGIWALNTLFPALAIQYTWETWLAYLLLFSSVGAFKLGSKK
jgi:hypothetical protein